MLFEAYVSFSRDMDVSCFHGISVSCNLRQTSATPRNGGCPDHFLCRGGLFVSRSSKPEQVVCVGIGVALSCQVLRLMCVVLFHIYAEVGDSTEEKRRRGCHPPGFLF